jgi:folate-binding protein YgfZ
VAAGIPRIYAASSGEFVAQMLNLDLLNGIAWDKGCYTGQEIIARAHYRGQMKRRMQRFRVVGQTQPNPGAMHTTTDGQRVQVVRPASHADGHVEILAVAPLEPRSIDALPLPYSLPA